MRMTPLRSWMRWRFLVLVPFAALVLGVIFLTESHACGCPATAGVAGVLEETGGIGDLHVPIPGTVTLTSPVEGRSYSVRVPRNGVFSADVLAGQYVIVGHSPLYQDGRLPCFPEGSDVVTAGTSGSITVSCPLS